MKKQIMMLLAVVLVVSMFVGCTGSKETAQESGGQKKTESKTDSKTEEMQVITIKAETKGAEETRVNNLVEASKVLNEELKAQGKNMEVLVETSAFDGSLDDYRKRFILGFKSKNEPDIFVTGHEDIAWLADAKYILNLDEMKQSEAYADVYETLWEAITWNGHVWGVLQDTEARPVFFNVKVLAELGWSQEEIDSLPDRVIKGEFTLADMSATAQEALDKGLVDWGIMHRPTNGPDFHMMTMNFGARLYDEKEDKVVFDQPAILNFLEYLKSLTVDSKLTPSSVTSMEWSNVHQVQIDGKSVFYYGGIWNIFNYVQQGANYEEMLDQFDFMLVPAVEKGGKPMTLSHPMIYTVSAQTEHPDLVKRLLELVAAPEYQVKHSIETCHLPINKSGAEDSEFQKDAYLSSVTYMLDYTTFLPNNQNFNKYSDALYKAIQGVEIGQLTPEEAIEFMETELASTLGEDIIIKK